MAETSSLQIDDPIENIFERKSILGETNPSDPEIFSINTDQEKGRVVA
jgi:hypothetical protein